MGLALTLIFALLVVRVALLPLALLGLALTLIFALFILRVALLPLAPLSLAPTLILALFVVRVALLPLALLGMALMLVLTLLVLTLALVLAFPLPLCGLPGRAIPGGLMLLALLGLTGALGLPVVRSILRRRKGLPPPITLSSIEVYSSLDVLRYYVPLPQAKRRTSTLVPALIQVPSGSARQPVARA